MSYLMSSPLLFLRPAGKSSCAGQRLEFVPSLKEVEMLSFFAEPASFEDGLEAGFERDLIESLRKKGLLLDCDEAGNCQASSWEIYNLQRAAFLMFSCFSEDSGAASFKLPLARKAESDFADNFSRLLNRRTERFFTDEAMSLALLKRLSADLTEAIAADSWLSFRVIVQNVEGLEAGVYAYDKSRAQFNSVVDEFSRKDLMECLHGQWWLNGGGVCWVFVVSLEELAKSRQEYPRNYFEMILLLGAAGQALVNSVTKAGLGTWMTPALSESLSAKILGLDPNKEEALYFFKVGIPERVAEKREEKRTPI